MKKSDKEKYMLRALELARKGEGRTNPNPMVGAVIVKNGRIIGEGYHHKAGGPHAERLALRRAGAQARGAHLFVNLEPCCHFGRTPPCADALIESGIKTVTVGMLDPNPRVSGGGVRKLRRAGMKVDVGILGRSCREANEVFIKTMKTGMPFVLLKAALTLDGKIATPAGDSRWISGPQSRELVHEMRNRVDAVLVGATTALRDDPRLTTRLKNKRGRNPVRILVDRDRAIPLKSRALSVNEPDRVLYVTSHSIAPGREKSLLRQGVEVLKFSLVNGRIDFRELMLKLGQLEITHVMIEGGSEIFASALEAKVVDKVWFFIAPLLLGGRNSTPVIGGKGVDKIAEACRLKKMSLRKIGEDILVEGYL